LIDLKYDVEKKVVPRVVLKEQGKYGFRSLGNTAVRGLQMADVPAEIREGIVGHELDDEHHAAYSRTSMMKELLGAVGKLDWKVD